MAAGGKRSQSAGLEPARAEPSGFLVHPLNRLGTTAVIFVPQKCTPGGTRTHNLWLRKPTPYPLGYRGLPASVSGLVVEWLPATESARVRFPAHAFRFFVGGRFEGKGWKGPQRVGGVQPNGHERRGLLSRATRDPNKKLV